jgi:hypothetical protein
MNQPTRNILYVFLASPGGLEAERQLARDVVEEINRMFADATGWQVVLLGWEDTMPGFGRPQALINKDVDRCHIFVGLLHKRWGQPTGAPEYTSGFEEEFYRALQRRRDTGSPEMFMVFKQIEDRTDPGEQMQRVLRFRESQIQNKELLFKEIGGTAEWERNLREWLSHAVLERYSGENVRQVESSTSLQAPRTTDDEESLREVAASEPDQALPLQLREIGGRVAQAALASTTGNFYALIGNLTEFEILRLLLATEAAASHQFDAEVLSTHKINRLYRYKSDLQIDFAERLLMFRTLVADSNNITPGWYWYEGFGFSDSGFALLFLTTSDRDDTIRTNALGLLRSAGAIPTHNRRKGSKARRGLVTTLLQESAPQVRSAAISYISRIGTLRDIPAIESVVATANTGDVSDLRLLIATIRAKEEPSELFRDLLATNDLASSHVEQLVSTRSRIDEPLLHEGLRHTSPLMRRLSAIALFEGGHLTTDEARLLSNDVDQSIRITGILGLTRAGVPIAPAEARQRTESEKKPDGSLFALRTDGRMPTLPNGVADVNGFFSESDVVVFEILRTKPYEQVASSVEWLGNGWIAYRVLALDHFRQEETRIRKDLASDFKRLESAWLAEWEREHPGLSADLVTKHMPPHVRQFVIEELASSALAGIATNGRKTDAKFGRKYLDSQYDIAKRQAIRVLRRFGNSSDVEPLLRTARNSYGSTQREALEAAVALGWGTSEDPIPSMLVSGEVEQVRVAIQWLLSHKYGNSSFSVRPLLWHEKDEIRTLAVGYLCEVLDRDALEQMVIDYPKEQGSYYYNVVCWLDRLLFSPEPFRTTYRTQVRDLVRKKP